MNEVVVKIFEISGINPKDIEQMVAEVKNPSPEQKIADELYFLREQNAALENQVILLKDERARLKKSVESAISIIVGTSYSSVDDRAKQKLDEFRKQAAETLRTSDILGLLIGE
ncbi:hypothetical protein [Clostridium sp. HMP27]|uniref:hypothetical protein n=1 Tax=Clostridium sp. HMP27 TaxID=1487921 RepID=UPI00052C5703|nr:hypothetical protein [Clostridium sp. HMP27]KGK88009.1 hypothetical protein DP68_08735 [Clostridium sp. HMP27]